MTPKDLIELAISRGVPLFNADNPQACVSIYEITARALLLLDRDQIDERSAEVLRMALRKAGGQRHPAQQAWTLRAALDEVWDNLPTDPTQASMPQTEREMVSLFEFERRENAQPRWFSVNDNVMGGISRGGFEQISDSTAAFRGTLSLENNGGFSTMRSEARDLGLGGFEGIAMRVRGDGRTYALSALKTDNRSEVRTWRREFAAQGEWQTIWIPFADLELSVMGRRYPGTSLDPAQIRSLGFSISDKNETPFRIEIDWIRAYRSSTTNP